MITPTIEIADIEPTRIFLERAEKGITKVFKQALVEGMEGMRDTAKEELEKASEAHSGKYWTGLLQSAIKADILTDKVGLFEGVVMVDPGVTRKGKSVVDYALPVEKGHRTGFGRTSVPPYKYMERALLLTRDPMVRRIESKLKEVIEAKTSYGTGWRNLATGYYAKGPAVKVKQ